MVEEIKRNPAGAQVRVADPRVERVRPTVRRCRPRGLLRAPCLRVGWRSSRCAMTIYPKRTKCRFGGFGAGRVQGCVACEARARAHRNFKDKDEFIQGMRGVLLKQKFGKDDDERKLTAAEVDRGLRCVLAVFRPLPTLAPYRCKTAPNDPQGRRSF